MRSARRLCLVMTMLLVCASAKVGGEESARVSRTWVDAKSGQEIQATLIQIDEASVKIRREDGKEFTISLSRLSDKDRAYVASQAQPTPRDEAPGVEKAERGARPAAADSLVLLRQPQGTHAPVLSGVVFRKTKDTAYIAAPFRKIDLHMNDKPSDATVIWGPNGEHHDTVAKRTTLLQEQQMWIYEAPANKMPPALDLGADIPKTGDVELVGYELVAQGGPMLFAPAQVKAKLVQPRDTRPTDRLSFTSDEGDRIHCFLVFTKQNKAIGFHTSPPLQGHFNHSLSARIIASLKELDQVKLIEVAVAAFTGDENKIDYQFVVRTIDPFEKIHNPKLVVKQLMEDIKRNDLPFKAEEAPKTIANGVEIELTKEAPKPEVDSQLTTTAFTPLGVPLVGKFAGVNPGHEGLHKFHVQFVYNDQAGKEVRVPVMFAQYGINGTHYSRAVKPPYPDIPGLDGQPFDAVRPKQLKEGGWQLTSRSTAVADPALPSNEHWPKPQPSTVKLGRPPIRAGGVTAIELKVAEEADKENNLRLTHTPILYSSDGSSVFLFAQGGKIRRVNSKTWAEERTLELGDTCGSVSQSAVGILAQCSDTLFLLDEETLQVKKEWKVDGVISSSASVRSKIAFAMQNTRDKNEINLYSDSAKDTALVMIDLESGKILHRIKDNTKSRQGPLSIQGRPLFWSPTGAIRLNFMPDGKSLLLGSRELDRYRLNGTDLIYEGQSRSDGSTYAQMAPSADGKSVAMLGESPLRGARVLDVFDIENLKAPTVTLKTEGHPQSIALDGKGQQIFLLQTGEVKVFNAEGAQTLSFALRDKDHEGCLHANPAGNQVIVCTRKKITAYELSKAGE